MLDLRLLFVAIVWGMNFTVVKYALGEFGPMSFTVARFFPAALVLLAIMAVRREPFALERNDRMPVVTLGLIGITGYNLLFMYGLRLTSASHSALFISMSPLFAAALQAAAGRERFSRSMVAGLLLASLGAYLIIQSSHGEISFSSGTLRGDLMTICASVLWALYTMKARPLLERYSPVKITAYTMTAGALLLLPFSMRELAGQSWSAVSAVSWAALAFAAFIGGSIAYVLWYEGVSRIGVTRTIVYHYLVPLVAVIFAAHVLGDRITLTTVLGGAAILSGVALVQGTKLA
jgi:drug/metabolite transporter (DMT)-like permease